MDWRNIASFGRLYEKVSDPARWRQRGYAFVRGLPFRLRVGTITPGTYVCYQPDRFSENYKKYVERTGNDILPGIQKFLHNNRLRNAGDLTRYYFLNLVIDQIIKENLKGDLAELGVYKGNTAFLLAETARRLGTTAYLFDTYSGFSKDDLKDIDSDKPLKFEDTSVEAVKALVGEENARFIQGYFPESTAQVADNLTFCLVHIDCDLYAPFRAALDYFYPRLVQGGFLIMHDYSSLHWDGAEKAVDEFFRDKPESIVPIPDKSGTAVVRKV